MSSHGGISLERAAEQLGVHYQTVYRWVRSGRLPASKVKGNYVVKGADLEELRRRRDQPTAAPPPSRQRIERQRRDMNQALHEGDESKVRSIARDLINSGTTVTSLIEEVIAPPLVEIGTAWHNGQLEIYVEHRAAGIAERLLGQILPNPGGRRRGRAMVAAVTGDLHSLPTAMATAALRENNWHVEHLGADVPVVELEKFAATHDIDLAVLSCSTTDRRRVNEAKALLQDSMGIPTLVGGGGASLFDLQAWARESIRKRCTSKAATGH